MAPWNSWVCERFDLRSICSQRAIVDGLNLLSVIALTLFFIISIFFVSSPRRNHASSSGEFYRKHFTSVVASICCGFTSIAYIGVGIKNLIIALDHDKGFNNWVLLYFLRALIWCCLSISLLIQRSKWIKIFVSIWWVLFFLMLSALQIEILVIQGDIQIIQVAEWFVSFLLFCCAVRSFVQLFCRNNSEEEASLSEPLINEGIQKDCSEIGSASFYSKLTFAWANDLLRLGYSKILELDDIPNLVHEDEAGSAYERFKEAWNVLLHKENSYSNIIFWSLANLHVKQMVLAGIYIFLRTISIIMAPLLLYAFVNYASNDIESTTKGFYLVGYLVIVKVVESISQRHFYFTSRRIGMQIRSALMVGVYQKQLKLSSLGRKRHSSGEIVNYIAVDAYRMGEFPVWLHLAWSSILQLFLSMILLFWIVGIGTLPGLVPLAVCGILNMPFAKLLKKYQFEFMVAQDKRLRATSEILNSMKVIKLQSWEDNFKNVIQSFRDEEFKWLEQSQHKKTYCTILFWMSPTIVSTAIFFGCIVFKSATLDAGTVFTVLAILKGIQEPVRLIPEILSSIIQVKVSLDRIQSFLLDHEIENERMLKVRPPSSTSTCIEIQNGNFSWDLEFSSPTLIDLHMKVHFGQKVAICGQVASGKSSLLYAILGEIPKICGEVKLFGSIAYVSQASWIQSGTIRDNILYGKEMEKGKYENVIRSCALTEDINSFSHGDLTEIGQRGLNLSGGQKQRIQLARAVYNDADIYLLDDPFSAVDAHTAAILFNDCVMTALEKKTVVLVTHQVEILSSVDQIMVVEGGKITQSGSYDNLLKNSVTFEQLVNAHKDAVNVLEFSTETMKISNGEVEEVNGCSVIKGNNDEEISSKIIPMAQLTKEEEKEVGDLGWKPFSDYILISNGTLFASLSIIAQFTFTVLQAAASYWLAFAIQVPNITGNVLVGVYAVISTIGIIFIYMRSFYANLLGLKASKFFFLGFINSIFKAPMLFFDSTPVGRILTRASSDLGVLDFDIPFAFAFAVCGFIELIVIIAIMAYVTWPILIVAFFAAIATLYVQGYYHASSRELMRINGTTKAPVMNYASETSLGVVTIRAFNTAKRFSENFLKLVDSDAKIFFYNSTALEWLTLRVEAFQNLTLFVGAFLLVLLPKGYLAPGLVGLSLSYALGLSMTQVFLTRWYCSLANYMISVERIKQFMQLPSEPPAILENSRPPNSWPFEGRIDFECLKIRYRPNAPLVLHGITCTFIGGTRVGVAGRTGSGKTTLVSALFRLVEAESGRILIDGLDICSIGLKDLRMKLSIIPQEPTLFNGSIRSNIDPLGLYSDDEIWEALKKCQLNTFINSLPNLLDSSVRDDGENWSAGQRQLLCLGRVLLKRNQILVLDEATASIDSVTDSIIQRIIRQEFSKCTVITIAHRVPTIVDSDKVMVLSFGKLVEYDEPSKLMETDSYFAKLVDEYWSSCRGNSRLGLSMH
ncbi:ABC transporter C family member 8 [Impatiens glandulifera]|uniref:ABC transporter C family member 8 n=1 Tax=Impatiens glandulifera TaxID=253017 RepID=UPI001FB146D2|nr:ABC transporter C family member 8 [Impatiens glandulifera]